MILGNKIETVNYLSLEIAYIFFYPLFLTLTISLLLFIDGFAQDNIDLILSFQLESMKLTSYVATMNQQGAIDTMTTGIEAITKLGIYEGMYQILELVIITLIVWSVLIEMPKSLLNFIGNIDKRDATEKIEHKLDKTGV